jgi:hypothetical protein
MFLCAHQLTSTQVLASTERHSWTNRWPIATAPPQTQQHLAWKNRVHSLLPPGV